MKKVILLAMAVATSASATFAQEKTQEKAIKENSQWKTGWFTQLQAGASYTISEERKHASFGDLITPHVALSVGKYFSPSMGVRLGVGGWSSKSYLGKKIDDTYKYKYLQVNADALFNLTNIFMSYKEDRMFNLIGVAGIGYVHGFKNTKKHYVAATNSVVPRAGLQADFRFNKHVSVNLEAMGTLMHSDFNGMSGKRKYDATINVLAGLTYRFGRDFQRVDVIDPSTIQDLNDKINAQRVQLGDKNSEIDRLNGLNKELANRPNPVVTKEIKEEAEVLMNAVVVFRLGSAQLEKNQDINIFNAARYLQDNPDVNVTITGYADKSTGSQAVNQRISEKRANAVANILIEKYNIAASRLTVQGSGDKEQLFPTDEWNRVVVFTAKKK